jgi:hypothetical protein
MAVPIDSLQLDPDNARRHDDANRASIRASLVERGQVLPITVRLFNRRVMTGNGTLEEARALGWTHIAAIFLDYDEAQAAAWAIAHNRSAELATWDFEQLAATMLAFDGVDWTVAGWEPAELDELLAAMDTDDVPDAGPTTQPTAPPPPPPPPPGALPPPPVPPPAPSTNPRTEWRSMPEFHQEDKTPHRSIQVHFRSEQDVQDFAARVGQRITENTRYLWFPFIEIETYADKTYK